VLLLNRALAARGEHLVPILWGHRAHDLPAGPGGQPVDRCLP
jgi:hypothetical protein